MTRNPTCTFAATQARLVIAAAAGLLFVPGLRGQNVYRELVGVVTDRGDEPLKGAIVEVEDENTHAVVSYITDKEGHFDFKRLREDTDYQIWATYRGVRSKSRELSHFDSKEHPEFKFVIKLD